MFAKFRQIDQGRGWQALMVFQIIEEERGGLERREGGREEVRKGETDMYM